MCCFLCQGRPPPNFVGSSPILSRSEKLSQVRPLVAFTDRCHDALVWPLLARNGPRTVSFSGPLLRNERKCLGHPQKSESDPTETSLSLLIVRRNVSPEA